MQDYQAPADVFRGDRARVPEGISLPAGFAATTMKRANIDDSVPPLDLTPRMRA